MKPINLTIQIFGDRIVITQPETEITKSYRISVLNFARLGAGVMQIYMDALKAPTAPTIQKQGTRLARLSTSPDYWTTAEYAALHRISETTVKKYCSNGMLGARKIAGRWRIEGKG